jgi:ATP phosphoribosyltransferase regulatory subunit
MKSQRLHTPEGVRDIYSVEYESKLYLQHCLNEKLRQYGYHPIQTPTFEFFDIFGKEIGTTPSKDLYKFFDREGNTLVLRPDVTPSIARCAAKYFGEEDMPIRLCYMGNTFINNSSFQGRLKESTQLGAELIGDGSTDADAEILSMVAECLKACHLTDFQLSVGHADFFRGLMEAAGLLEEQEEELRALIFNKNFFGVQEFVSTLSLDPDLEALFGLLGNLYSGSDEMAEARSYAKKYPRILASLQRLEELYSLLELYGVARYVTLEPGMISNYQYYTGIIFAGYTFGSGEAIVRGGRYDKLLTFFGKDSAAIGFAFVVDQLMAALSRQNIETPLDHDTNLVVYKAADRAEAIAYASAKRNAGAHIELMLFEDSKSKEDYQNYARRNHISELTFFETRDSRGE